MSVRIGGYSANTLVDVESNTLAAKAVWRHNDWSPWVPYVGGGSYSRRFPISGTPVLPAPALSGSAFQFRWTSPGLVAAVRRVSVSYNRVVNTGAAVYSFSLFFARLFSVAGSGGNAWSGANNDGKRRNIIAPTAVNDARTFTVSGGLTAGTWVLDTDAIATVTTSGQNTIANEVGNDGVQTGRIVPIWEALPGEAPVVLAAQEGLSLNQANPGWLVGLVVRVEWDELPATAV